jgi:hypothetical protein
MMQVVSVHLAQPAEGFPGGSQMTTLYNYVLIQAHEIQDRAHEDAVNTFHTLEIQMQFNFLILYDKI